MPAPPRRLALDWAPPVLYMVAIFVQSSFPALPGVTGGIDWGDKGLHLVGYALLGFLLAGAARRTWPERPWARTGLLAWSIGTAFAASDELHQAFVPSRSAEVLDFVADALGTTLGVLLRNTPSFAPRRR